MLNGATTTNAAAGAPPADAARIAALAASIVGRTRARKGELGIGDQDVDVFYAHACGLFASGEDEACERTFALLAYVDPFAERHWLGLGAVRERRRNYPRAIEAFSMAAQAGVASPSGAANPLAPLHAAQCYLALGMLDEALDALGSAAAWDGPEHAAADVTGRVTRLLDTIERRLGADDGRDVAASRPSRPRGAARSRETRT